MDANEFFDKHWSEIVSDPEGFARRTARYLPLEHPGAAIEAAAVRHGMTPEDGQALFDRLFAEWKRVYDGPADSEDLEASPRAR